MANHLPELYAVLAEMYGKAGQPDEGLEIVGRALALVEKSDERYHEAELYRLRGELRLQAEDYAAGAVAAAEADFDRATEVAQHQEAKSLELRAAMSRYRLWRDHGTLAEAAGAREALGDVYAWFTEGFDTRDLRGARALLTEAG